MHRKRSAMQRRCVQCVRTCLACVYVCSMCVFVCVCNEYEFVGEYTQQKEYSVHLMGYDSVANSSTLTGWSFATYPQVCCAMQLFDWRLAYNSAVHLCRTTV